MWNAVVEVLTSDAVPMLCPSQSDLDLELLEDYPELLLLGVED